MSKTREIAEEILEENSVVDAMLIFARQMCEKQKQECLESSKMIIYNDEKNNLRKIAYDRNGNTIEIYEDSILNSKNVCDE